MSEDGLKKRKKNISKRGRMTEEIKLDEMDLLEQDVARQLSGMRPGFKDKYTIVRDEKGQIDIGRTKRTFEEKDEDYFVEGKPISFRKFEVIPLVVGKYERDEMRLMFKYKPWYKPYRVIVFDEKDKRTADYIHILDSIEEYFREHLVLELALMKEEIHLYRDLRFPQRKSVFTLELERFSLDVKLAILLLDQEELDVRASEPGLL
ncbi:MAG: hypothetical protein KAT43_04740 [Nanoarchaeota archaeon]|nr:hypothetical protein [Nanoarchaeota archaeon]